MTGRSQRLVGCGILRAEVEWLARQNSWPLDAVWLDSTGHARIDRLYEGLSAALGHTDGAVVLYGACHPRIDLLVGRHGAHRVAAQSCIAMLLGDARYQAELASGAFFLLEEWARRWDELVAAAFGRHRAVAREIFQGSHTRMLAIRTPCSGDFAAEAEAAAASVGLPLAWCDVDLTELERTVKSAIEGGHA